eukprot:CAMPEP_0117777432 /NCGR_PEP_ID=MMETSP0948-20121206/382_1 /TAXON_ID=44440 /ORGANISM="Chattonella subsalsa, Strain CCMP2191" /LENGTH=461 /DNA_ID=CAMNT_0005604541 /DNA_START=38 /DNA_END=1419 /DNA_ORIENTATION=+
MKSSANLSGSASTNPSNNSAAGRSKYTSLNLNAVTKAPTTKQPKSGDLRYGAGGRLLILGKKPGDPSGAPTAAQGAGTTGSQQRVAAPVPLNTASLRRENNGNDVGVSLVNRGAGAAGASWGNKVSQSDGKDADKSDSSQANSGVWKDKDDEPRERSRPLKRSDSKWGDDDDSPLDNEQFPGLQDSFKDRAPVNEKDQLRPNRGGGRENEEGYRSWKREAPPRDMEGSGPGRDWRSERAPPPPYHDGYPERGGGYERGSYHGGGGYGDQYGKDYGGGDLRGDLRPPPPPPPGPPPYDDRYPPQDNRFGGGGYFQGPGTGDFDLRRVPGGPPPDNYAPYPQQQQRPGVRQYDRSRSYNEGDRGRPYDQDEGGYRNYGRDPDRYGGGSYTPSSRNWKHHHPEEADQPRGGGYRPTGVGAYDRGGPLMGPGGAQQQQLGWRDRMASRGRGGGGFIDQGYSPKMG